MKSIYKWFSAIILFLVLWVSLRVIVNEESIPLSIYLVFSIILTEIWSLLDNQVLVISFLLSIVFFIFRDEIPGIPRYIKELRFGKSTVIFKDIDETILDAENRGKELQIQQDLSDDQQISGKNIIAALPKEILLVFYKLQGKSVSYRDIFKQIVAAIDVVEDENEASIYFLAIVDSIYYPLLFRLKKENPDAPISERKVVLSLSPEAKEVIAKEARE